MAAAVAEERGIRIEAIDSRSATVGQGAMVLEAACIAQAGGTMDEAIERVKNIRRTHKIYFIPDSLTNLVKGGRASKFQGLATSVLNLKIVVSLTETGAIEVLHKAKGMKNAVNYIVKLMAERTREVGPSVYYKLHTKAYKALEYMDAARSRSRRTGALPHGGDGSATVATAWACMPWGSSPTPRSTTTPSSTTSPST